MARTGKTGCQGLSLREEGLLKDNFRVDEGQGPICEGSIPLENNTLEYTHYPRKAIHKSCQATLSHFKWFG